MANIRTVNDQTFESEVLQASEPVLVDFNAVWCGPCKMLKPIVEQLASEWADQVKVVEMDVDHNPSVVMRYQVMAVPTLMLFVDGEPRERLSGYQPKDRITSKLSPYISLS